MTMANIAVWGDSIGRAVGFSDSLNRYAVIKPNYREMLLQSQSVNIINHARFGATLPEGLADFLEAGEVDAQAVAIQFGGNDCNYDWAAVSEYPDQPHSPRTALEAFEKGLRQFVRQVQSRGKIAILVTPPPLDAQRFFAWVTNGLNADAILGFLGDLQHIYRWQERYAAAIHRAALATRSRLFDLRDAFLAADNFPDYLCLDGMHPNEKGQRLIASAIRDALPRLG
ncbi:MAG: SGNH/GDSL hydrolase family protein [Eubacteriales bacterium]|nr:SGNH/GDSL hydrolase family protein [Eubacteriales bacterium]